MAYYETLHVLTQQAGRYLVSDIEQAAPYEVEAYSAFLTLMYEKRRQAAEN